MKIALCFSGQIRDFRVTRRSLQRHIISRLGSHEIFVFAHYPLDSESGLENIGLPLTDVIVEDEALVPSPEQNQSDKKHLIDLRKWHNGNPIRSFYLQLRSIYLANQLRQEFEQKHGFEFDWVFRLRFDNLYYGDNLEDLAQCDPSCIYLPSHDNWWGYNDKFAFGGPRAMNAYVQRFNAFEIYQDEGYIMHPEAFLKWVIDRHGILVRRTQVANHLLRYGSLCRSTSSEKYGDIEKAPRTWTGKVDQRLRVTRFNRLLDQLYLAKVRAFG